MHVELRGQDRRDAHELANAMLTADCKMKCRQLRWCGCCEKAELGESLEFRNEARVRRREQGVEELEKKATQSRLSRSQKKHNISFKASEPVR